MSSINSFGGFFILILLNNNFYITTRENLQPRHSTHLLGQMLTCELNFVYIHNIYIKVWQFVNTDLAIYKYMLVRLHAYETAAASSHRIKPLSI